MSRSTFAPALAFVAAAVLAAVATPASAQLPADARWQTIESTNFRVTYEAGLEDVARHAAASAERAHAALLLLVDNRPTGPIDIVVADHTDISNGYATPLPSNRIVVYASPPTTVLELQYVRDWIDLVVTHELAHIFHMDLSGSVGRFLRRIFGRLPLPWPVFSALGTPLWSIEGLAVAIESAVAGHGRIHGSYHEMVVRTAVLEDEIDSIDRLSSTTPVWPGASRVYLYGSLFHDYLVRRYGPDVTARIVGSTRSAVIPAPLWFDGVGRSAIGVSFRVAYDEWRAEMHQRFGALAAELAEQGLTAGEPLTRHGAIAHYPRYSRDGRMIVYAASDWRRPSRTRVIDVVAAAEPVEVWSRRRNDIAPAAWLPDGALLTSTVDYLDAFRIHSDVYNVSSSGDRRITRGARIDGIDVSRAGRAVAVESSGGTNRLVLLDPASGGHRPINNFADDVLWALPRFDPSGARIAVGRWQVGGSFDIVVMDTLGATSARVAAGGISAAPAWSPDGRWLLFWSDRTGIPNLFAADVADGTLRQVTNVLTGAYFPDVSPDGRWIVYSAYHHDGFSIERMAFDPSQWREPMAEGLAALPEARGLYLQADRTEQFMRDVTVAVQSTDTMAGQPHDYRALRHARPYFWLPYADGGGTQNTFVGVWTFGSDLVGRHAWDASVSVAPQSGQTQARLAYGFSGLPAITSLSLQPGVALSLSRDWDVYSARRAVGQPYIDEREDIAAGTISLTRRRWRSTSGLSMTGEAVRRSRYLYDAGDSLRLRDPADDLLGVRAFTWFSNAVAPPLAISRENGVALQLGGRRRWERDPITAVINEREVEIDASYSELTTWNAVYLALPLPGFARHVLAGRVSGLLRDGPGAGLTNIGGASTAGFAIPGVSGTLGGGTTLLPVRGFDRGVRHGDRAWTASGEYRFPLALITSSLRPLPFYFDRLAASVFVDAGHAWCSTTTAERLPDPFCPSTSASAAPLVGAGTEVTAFLSTFGLALPLRLTFAAPVSGGPETSPRFHLTVGQAF